MRKILFLAANPKDSARLRLDKEMRDIQHGLERSRKRDEFYFVQRWAVRSRDFRRAIQDESPQIVHFSGHGKDKAGIYFEDDMGNSKLISGAALASAFELFAERSRIQCVILNGCYSRYQAEPIVNHVPYVIGMQQSISDQASIEFSVGFYDALGSGSSIEFAFKSGKVAIGLESEKFGDTPVLLTQKSVVSGSESVFDADEAAGASEKANSSTKAASSTKYGQSQNSERSHQRKAGRQEKKSSSSQRYRPRSAVYRVPESAGEKRTKIVAAIGFNVMFQPILILLGIAFPLGIPVLLMPASVLLIFLILTIYV